MHSKRYATYTRFRSPLSSSSPLPVPTRVSPVHARLQPARDCISILIPAHTIIAEKYLMFGKNRTSLARAAARFIIGANPSGLAFCPLSHPLSFSRSLVGLLAFLLLRLVCARKRFRHVSAMHVRVSWVKLFSGEPDSECHASRPRGARSRKSGNNAN